MLYGYNFKYCLGVLETADYDTSLRLQKNILTFLFVFVWIPYYYFKQGLCETLAFNIRDALKLSKGGSSLLRQKQRQ